MKIEYFILMFGNGKNVGRGREPKRAIFFPNRSIARFKISRFGIMFPLYEGNIVRLPNLIEIGLPNAQRTMAMMRRRREISN